MNDPKSQQEPSMEEILASIRRIISEDDAEGDEGAAEVAGEESVADEPLVEEPDEDVLELTEAVEDEAESGPEVDDYDLELTDDADLVEVMDAEEEPEPDPFDEPVAAPPAPVEVAPPAPDSDLISPPPASAATSQFAALAAAVAGERMGQSMGVGARTIEDLVKEVMRPIIKEWLDENLPALVERLVGREIDRMARRAEDEVGD